MKKKLATLICGALAYHVQDQRFNLQNLQKKEWYNYQNQCFKYLKPIPALRLSFKNLSMSIFQTYIAHGQTAPFHCPLSVPFK